MKNMFVFTGLLVSSLAVAQNPDTKQETPSKAPSDRSAAGESGSLPNTADKMKNPQDFNEENSKSNLEIDKNANNNQKKSDRGPYGASFSLGLINIKESSDDLNGSGFARVEWFRLLNKKLPIFARLELGLSFAGADIGGKIGTNGAYKGSVNSYAIAISGYTPSMGGWTPRTNAEFGITKIKKIPAYDFIAASTAINYGPFISLNETFHYQIYEGLAIGPSIGLTLGAVSGWNLGAQALFAY